jgi:hypothetical protein
MLEIAGMAQERREVAPGLIAIPFQPHHLANMDVARHQRGLVDLMGGDLLHATGNWLAAGPAYSLIADGRIVAAGGVFPWAKWRGQAWAYVGGGFAQRREAFVPFMVEFLDERQAHGMHRIEAVVSLVPMYPRRFAERLGFEKPRLMDRYNPDGTDALMYARLRPEPIEGLR